MIPAHLCRVHLSSGLEPAGTDSSKDWYLLERSPPRPDAGLTDFCSELSAALQCLLQSCLLHHSVTIASEMGQGCIITHVCSWLSVQIFCLYRQTNINWWCCHWKWWVTMSDHYSEIPSLSFHRFCIDYWHEADRNMYQYHRCKYWHFNLCPGAQASGPSSRFPLLVGAAVSGGNPSGGIHRRSQARQKT